MTAVLAMPNRATFMRRSTASESEASEKLATLERKLAEETGYSVTWSRSADVLRELMQVYKECSVADWDGYGAEPLSENSVQEAHRFVLTLPILFPMPDVVPEPSGDVGFQWHFGKDRIFTASFSGHNLITYAGILGSPDHRKYGSEDFNDSIPQEIIEYIGRIQPRTKTEPEHPDQ